MYLGHRAYRSGLRGRTLEPAVDTPLPRPGHIRFYVLTSEGVVTADALEQDLGENRHVLSPLFYAAQELITEIRTSDEASR